MYKNQDAVVLEYLDFYKHGYKGQDIDLKYFVFDSKFTNYQNLAKLDNKAVKFTTIRRGGKKIVEQIIRKYSHFWLVEKTIAEKMEFFHFNRLSS